MKEEYKAPAKIHSEPHLYLGETLCVPPAETGSHHSVSAVIHQHTNPPHPAEPTDESTGEWKIIVTPTSKGTFNFITIYYNNLTFANV